MASTRKRKRQADESFRTNFMELRDTGVPDTGPKRPKDKRTISLTPAIATASSAVSTTQAVQEEASVGRRGRGKRLSQGRGRRKSGARGSLREKTPRTQLREDIRDLINSAVQRDDVTPAPPRTVLTPHVPTPHHSASLDERDSLPVVEHSTEEHSLPPESPGLVEETPMTTHSRVLRSALKGVHSLSSLRKRSLISHTPHSVTFRDHITVTEYSPEMTGPHSTLDSSTSSSSPPSPLSSRTTISADFLVGEDPQLEPLEEEDEEEGEGEGEGEEVEGGVEVEGGEEEEEGEGEGEGEEEGSGSVNGRLQTPHLHPKSPKLSPKQATIRSSSVRRKPQKAVKKHVRKSKQEDVPRPPKTLSRTLIKNLFMLFGKRRMTADAVDLVVKFSEVYLKRCSQDLATYTGHAGRKTMEVEDAILLMKRQRFISGSETFEYLVNTHLPLEYVEELLPCAVAGRKIVPTRVK